MYNPYSLKDKNLKSQLILLIARECLRKISEPLAFSSVFWEVEGERQVFMQLYEKLPEASLLFSIFFSLYRMIVSETGIPTSLLTKVKDALFLAVYFMEKCHLIFPSLPADFLFPQRPASCLILPTLGD